MDGFAEPLDEDDLADKLTKLRSGDVDKQINAVQYLGIRFEASAQHPLPSSSPDALILILPPLLSSHSNLLYTSVLSNFLPFLIPLLPPEKLGLAVKVIVVGANGLWDKVADGKERVHKPAEECLVQLGRLAFRSNPNAGESNVLSSSTNTGLNHMQVTTTQENFLNSLASHLATNRSARVKIGALRILREIKTPSAIPSADQISNGQKAMSWQENGKALGLKTVLPSLVALLEDGDGGVRESARETITSLLSPPTVPLAARTELKKLMLSKSLKSTVVDGIMRAIELASPSQSSGDLSLMRIGDNGNAAAEGARSVGGGQKNWTSKSVLSGASQDTAESTSIVSNQKIGSAVREEHGMRPMAGGVEVKAVHVITDKELEKEFEVMRTSFQGKETEDNWRVRERAIHRVRGMLLTDVHREFQVTFLECLKAGFLNESVKALTSLRSTMSIATSDLYIELARALGILFDPLLDIALTPLARMSSLNKKILASKSQEALSALITYTSCVPKVFFPHLVAGVSDKVIQARIYFAVHLKLYLEIHAESSRSLIEHAPNGGVSNLVDCIKKGLNDPNPDVKLIARQAYWIFRSGWQKEGVELLKQVDEGVRKAVEKVGASSSNGTASRSVSAGTSKLAEAKVAVRKPSGAIAAAMRKARMEAASGQAEEESRDQELTEPLSSTPSTPRERKLRLPASHASPSRVPLPPTPSPQRMPPLGTPSPDGDLLRSSLPQQNGQLLDLIDTPIRAPSGDRRDLASRNISGVPAQLAGPMHSNQSLPNDHGQIRLATQRRTVSSALSPNERQVKSNRVAKPMLDRRPPSTLFAGLGTRSDCTFWLDRKDEYVHGDPSPVTPEDEAFLLELTADLNPETFEQLGDLSCEAPNDGSAGTLQNTLEIRKEVRRVQSAKPEGNLRPQWGHVCDILIDWLIRDVPRERLDTGLFVLWDLAIRHSPAISGIESGIMTACLHLAGEGDFQTRRGSVALLAFWAETTCTPFELARAFVGVCRMRCGGQDGSQLRGEKALEVTMIICSILVMRMEPDEVRPTLEDMKELVMQGMSSPAVAVREATSTFLIAIHKRLNDEDLLLGTTTPTDPTLSSLTEAETGVKDDPKTTISAAGAGLLPDLTPEQRSLLVYQFKAHAEVSCGVGVEEEEQGKAPDSAGVASSWNGSGSLGGSAGGGGGSADEDCF